jgi:putative ABC transport system permease protein
MRMLNIAFRNIFRQRTRAALTLAAIAMGIAGLVISGGFVDDLLFQLRESTIHSQLGHIQIYRQGQFASGGQRPFDFLVEDSVTTRHALSMLPGAILFARRLSFSGLMSNGRGGLPVVGEGVEPEAEARIGSAITLLSGRRLTVTDAHGIIVGEGLARALKVDVGDRVDLLLSTRDGAMNALQFNVVGVFRSLSKEYDARAVRIHLDAAQELVGTSGVSAIVVLLKDTRQTAAAINWLKVHMPQGLEAKSWRELADFYTSTEALYRRQFTVLEAIILAMLLLSVGNSVNMTLHERTPEFGIMRALGNSSRDVFRLVVLETSLLGTIGGVWGIASGAALAIIVSAVGIPMPPPPNSETGFIAAIRVVPAIIATAFALGILASIGASLLPGRNLSRISVAEALRGGV